MRSEAIAVLASDSKLSSHGLRISFISLRVGWWGKTHFLHLQHAAYQPKALALIQKKDFPASDSFRFTLMVKL